MKPALQPGLHVDFSFKVPENKTVPHLFPEAPEFALMPKVMATGFLVGLIEWACIRAVNPYLDWPEEQTLGVGMQLKHMAPTPPGMTVTVSGTLTQVNGKQLIFDITAHDGVDQIAAATHERFIVNAPKFNAKIARKGQ